MKLALGIDPGSQGAVCAYDLDAQTIFQIWDMPIFQEHIGRTKKPRLDVPGLMTILDTCKELGAEIAILEEVGGLPRQSATHAFTFGWTTGCTYAALVASRIAVERVRPAVWKKMLRCGKTDDEIVRRAQEMFPDDTHRWTGPKGGVKDGRCEAAMLALFGAKHAYGRV